MTSAVQAGLFYGDNAGIPAFRWFDKGTGRMFVSNHPAGRPGPGPAPGRRGGPVRGGPARGRGEHQQPPHRRAPGTNVMTMAGMVTDEGKRQISTRDFYTYLANPYNLLRGLLGFIGDVCVEYWEAWRQEREQGRAPDAPRGGLPLPARGDHRRCCATPPCG